MRGENFHLFFLEFKLDEVLMKIPISVSLRAHKTFLRVFEFRAWLISLSYRSVRCSHVVMAVRRVFTSSANRFHISALV